MGRQVSSKDKRLSSNLLSFSIIWTTGSTREFRGFWAFNTTERAVRSIKALVKAKYVDT